MLPWVFGFSWSVGNVIFLGIFYCVVLAVLCTMAIASGRAILDLKARKDDLIRWEAEFEDLPAAARVCRHQLTGEVKHRICTNGFKCGSCAAHSRFLERRATVAAEACSAAPSPADASGFDMPADCYYHRGHTWVRLEPDGTATVGLDDFGSRMVGKVDEVTFPGIGNVLQINGTGWHMTRSGSTIRVLSPLEGELLETGGPEQGWYLRLKPTGAGFDARHLLRGAETHSWILREVERLQLALQTEGVGLSLADGGEVVKDVPSACPEADWDAFWGDTFLEP